MEQVFNFRIDFISSYFLKSIKIKKKKPFPIDMRPCKRTHPLVSEKVFPARQVSFFLFSSIEE